MRKFLLALVAALSLVIPAVAAPYKVVDANGVPMGPVIGIGLMITTAPDGTHVGLVFGREGFIENGNEGIDNAALVLVYLQPDCTGLAYIDASRLPVKGNFFSPTGANGGTGQVDYPAPPYIEAGTFYTVVNGVCTLAYNSATTPYMLGVGQVFNISHPTPFAVVPWTAPDTDPPTQ
jgi:hypothetical protein